VEIEVHDGSRPEREAKRRIDRDYSVMVDLSRGLVGFGALLLLQGTALGSRTVISLETFRGNHISVTHTSKDTEHELHTK
jgi:hypothetical protein